MQLLTDQLLAGGPVGWLAGWLAGWLPLQTSGAARQELLFFLARRLKWSSAPAPCSTCPAPKLRIGSPTPLVRVKASHLRGADHMRGSTVTHCHKNRITCTHGGHTVLTLWWHPTCACIRTRWHARTRPIRMHIAMKEHMATWRYALESAQCVNARKHGPYEGITCRLRRQMWSAAQPVLRYMCGETCHVFPVII